MHDRRDSLPTHNELKTPRAADPNSNNTWRMGRPCKTVDAGTSKRFHPIPTNRGPNGLQHSEDCPVGTERNGYSTRGEGRRCSGPAVTHPNRTVTGKTASVLYPSGRYDRCDRGNSRAGKPKIHDCHYRGSPCRGILKSPAEHPEQIGRECVLR